MAGAADHCLLHGPWSGGRTSPDDRIKAPSRCAEGGLAAPGPPNVQNPLTAIDPTRTRLSLAPGKRKWKKPGGTFLAGPRASFLRPCNEVGILQTSRFPRATEIPARVGDVCSHLQSVICSGSETRGAKLIGYPSPGRGGRVPTRDFLCRFTRQWTVDPIHAGGACWQPNTEKN